MKSCCENVLYKRVVIPYVLRIRLYLVVMRISLELGSKPSKTYVENFSYELFVGAPPFMPELWAYLSMRFSCSEFHTHTHTHT